jgi:hypothetical protein
MAVPPMKAVAARLALWRGRKARSQALGASLLAGLWLGAACGGAETVSIPNTTCTPRLCLAPDVPPGPPDGATLCPPGVCNYQTQVGCPTGQTCAVSIDPNTGEPSPKCVAAGLRQAGEECDTRTMPSTPAMLCARGLICVGPQGSPQICRKLCCAEEGASYGDWRACDPGESCIRQLQTRIEQPPGSGNFITHDAKVSFCVPVNNCDVLDSQSCKDDPVRPVCRIADPVGNVACQPSGGAKLGEPCQKEDQCGSVQKCAQRIDFQGVPQSDKTCRRLCRITLECGSSACPEGEGVCVHFKRDPEGVGECTPNFDQDTHCHEVEGGVLPMQPPAVTDAGTG